MQQTFDIGEERAENLNLCTLTRLVDSCEIWIFLAVIFCYVVHIHKAYDYSCIKYFHYFVGILNLALQANINSWFVIKKVL